MVPARARTSPPFMATRAILPPCFWIPPPATSECWGLNRSLRIAVLLGVVGRARPRGTTGDGAGFNVRQSAARGATGPAGGDDATADRAGRSPSVGAAPGHRLGG